MRHMTDLLKIRIFAIAIAFAMLAGMTFSATDASAGEAKHRVAVHVDSSDAKIMNMALNNVQNIKKYYDSKGQSVKIEVVAYGPGLHMLRADTSPVKERVAVMSLANPNLTFSACGNTHAKMSKKAGKTVVLLSEARKVPSGVIRLIELQEEGYSYIRP
ncbi:MAG: DsrE family protein [Alphaproteobacteria bacterium]